MSCGAPGRKPGEPGQRDGRWTVFPGEVDAGPRGRRLDDRGDRRARRERDGEDDAAARVGGRPASLRNGRNGGTTTAGAQVRTFLIPIGRRHHRGPMSDMATSNRRPVDGSEIGRARRAHRSAVGLRTGPASVTADRRRSRLPAARARGLGFVRTDRRRPTVTAPSDRASRGREDVAHERRGRALWTLLLVDGDPVVHKSYGKEAPFLEGLERDARVPRLRRLCRPRR